MTHLCPCHSSKAYKDCCEPFHTKKKLPQTALDLMRSRYSAYSLNLASYIIDTTHPLNSQYKINKIEWKKEIQNFSKLTTFKSLKIINFEEDQESAIVSFEACLIEEQEEITLREKSFFIKEKGKWLYRSFEWI
jgi:SEC-C motif-containing protein